MRIIGGEYKGRPILFPGKSRARPTSNSIKESLFDILESLRGKLFLDIFAGSGSVGIEALSRGAEYAVFIEKDPMLADFI
ncbi:MAG: RsmD family RNA methyltransferase, partial [Syntrophales bacterium LBB04]|nr:RsmD family RNA methyltransferase [Syntrophales bacterium LBB04]